MTETFSSSLIEGLHKEFNIRIPLKEDKKYQEIQNFDNYEFVYGIAYEMLIRTDKYNSLLKLYNRLTNSKIQISENKRTYTLYTLIKRMNTLGLNRNSFLGFDCQEDNIFKVIDLYNEINNSPWKVRTINQIEEGIELLINHYLKKNKLYYLDEKTPDIKNYKEFDLDYINALIMHTSLFIPIINNDEIQYKSLKDTIYLKELDKDFTNTLKENERDHSFRKIELDYAIKNEFWYEYTLDKIKYGLIMLINFYIKNNNIYSNINIVTEISLEEILTNPNNFFIKTKNTIKQINPEIPLIELDNDFLSELKFSDLIERNIEIESKFNRPKLILKEARIIDLPINLNLPKDELLYYISYIKDTYDRNNDIVKDRIEIMFDLLIENDNAEMPYKIKEISKGRKKLKEDFALAFYIYDLFKSTITLIQKLEKIENKKIIREKIIKKKKIKVNIKTEIVRICGKEVTVYNQEAIITAISHVSGIKEVKVDYLLSIMKEFIHGVNRRKEKNPLKKGWDAKNPYQMTDPKYKSIITGKSILIKSSVKDLVDNLNI
jgi:hypothetical protein